MMWPCRLVGDSAMAVANSMDGWHSLSMAVVVHNSSGRGGGDMVAMPVVGWRPWSIKWQWAVVVVPAAARRRWRWRCAVAAMADYGGIAVTVAAVAAVEAGDKDSGICSGWEW